MAALNTLKPKDLSECKTMQKPPPGVDDVFGVDERRRDAMTSWHCVRTALRGSTPDSAAPGASGATQVGRSAAMRFGVVK